jgi:hypothetical protein
VNKGGAAMKKGRLIGKIFGIVLVLVMIVGMLRGLPTLVCKVEASPATIYVPDNYPLVEPSENYVIGPDQSIRWGKLSLHDWTSSFSVSYGDYNNDGKTDFTAALLYDVIAFINEGGGQYTEEVVLNVDIWTRDVFCTDVDNDGADEIIAVNDNLGTVLLDRSSSGWTMTTLLPDEFGTQTSLYCCDMDGDQDTEVVVGVAGCRFYLVDKTDNEWIWSFLCSSSGTCADFFCEDIDKDGDIDIVCASGYGNKVLLFENEQDRWEIESLLQKNSDVLSIAGGDLDNDGDTEIIAGCEDGNVYLIDFNNANGSWETTSIFYKEDGIPHSVSSADVNRDTKMDVIIRYGPWTAPDIGHIDLLLNNGVGFSQSTVGEVGNWWGQNSIIICDVNSNEADWFEIISVEEGVHIFEAYSTIYIPSTIKVLKDDGLVEIMNLDEYVKGVVAAEMGSGWPIEALKAQAVAARTFAVYNTHHDHCTVDVCTDHNCCQAWEGPPYDATIVDAVTSTYNEVITYNGKIIREALFFSHCNGHTRNSEDYNGWDYVPYLRGVSCGCADEYGWTDYNGHGVGMCQYGAKVMAEQGFSYVNILKHYYSGVEITLADTAGNRVVARLCSPAEVRVYDSQERVTGLVNGDVKNEILYSDYYDNTVTILHPSGSYRYEVAGVGKGTYGLDIVSIEDSEATMFIATDIPITSRAVHQYTIDWDAFSQGEKEVVIRIDSNGDGTFERSIESDAELTRDEFVAAGEEGLLPFWIWIAIGAGLVAIVCAVIGRHAMRRRA